MSAGPPDPGQCARHRADCAARRQGRI